MTSQMHATLPKYNIFLSNLQPADSMMVQMWRSMEQHKGNDNMPEKMSHIRRKSVGKSPKGLIFPPAETAHS